MKMMKTMKKLKFWSRKKKKKKAFLIDHPPPPPPPRPPCHCQYQHYNPFEPSAPPLPTSSSSSLFEYDHETQETIYSNYDFTTSFTSPNQAQNPPTFAAEDINSVPELSPQNPTTQAASSTSYQQYMVPNPVYGVPIVPQVRRERRRGGAFGCIFAFGAHLFRCFFPCIHIRDVKK